MVVIEEYRMQICLRKFLNFWLLKTGRVLQVRDLYLFLSSCYQPQRKNMELTRSVSQSSVPVLIHSTSDNFQGLGFLLLLLFGLCFVFFFNWKFERIKTNSSRQCKWGDNALNHATWYKTSRGVLNNLNKYNNKILKSTQVIESQDLKFLLFHWFG